MTGRCIICGGEASFAIKGSSEKYCRNCALQSFSDLELLQKLEDHAQIINDILNRES